MPDYSDTQRIDYLAKLGCCELEHEYCGPVHVMSGFDKLGSGVNLRAAIDKAMRKAKVKPSRDVLPRLPS